MKQYTDPERPHTHTRLITTDKISTWRPPPRSLPITIFTVNIQQTGTIYQVIQPTPLAPRQATDCIQANEPEEATEPDTPETHPIFRANTPSQKFQNHLTRSPEWEKSLLTNIKFANSPSYVSRRIEQCHHQHKNLVAITDYSAQQKNACYGWLLCLPNGEALAECVGYNLGLPSGPRASAWGLLSVVTFLGNFLEYLQQPPTYMPNVTIMPAADAERTPLWESSRARQSAGSTPSRLAAVRNGSGAGLLAA